MGTHAPPIHCLDPLCRVSCEVPPGEVLFEFYGKLKMIARGYGSFDDPVGKDPGAAPHRH